VIKTKKAMNLRNRPWNQSSGTVGRETSKQKCRKKSRRTFTTAHD